MLCYASVVPNRIQLYIVRIRFIMACENVTDRVQYYIEVIILLYSEECKVQCSNPKGSTFI